MQINTSDSSGTIRARRPWLIVSAISTPKVLEAQEVAESPQRVGVKVDPEGAITTQIVNEVRMQVRKLGRPIEREPCDGRLSRQDVVVVTAARRQFHTLHTEL
jgi:hypothetical protein